MKRDPFIKVDFESAVIEIADKLQPYNLIAAPDFQKELDEEFDRFLKEQIKNN